MIQRRQSIDGIVHYVSPLLQACGVPHAFSTRIGGISPPPFDSLNLGNPMGCAMADDDARIQSNYARLQRAIGCEGLPRRYVHQVHGGVCLNADDPHFENNQKADAMLSQSPRQLLSIRIADCVPILMCDETGGTVAAVHAGWRGIVAGVLAATIEQFLERDHNHLFRAAIGPCISMQHFEVGPELLDEFTRLFGDDAPIEPQRGGKGHVDLRAACYLQLLQAGLKPEHIDTTDRCTFAHQDEFYSHRRDNGITGRMAALIAPCPSTQARPVVPALKRDT